MGTGTITLWSHEHCNLTRQKQMKPITSYAVYTGCGTTQQVVKSKLMPHSISGTPHAYATSDNRTNGFGAYTMTHSV